MTAAVAARGVGVARDGVGILRGVDLTVAPGEWVTVVGPNGAGKSTLLRAVSGLLPYDGSVSLFGTELRRIRRRARARLVAAVPQQPVVPPGMTVLDYLLLGRTPHLRPLAQESAADVATVERILGLLQLSDLADRQLTTLSGGERQRVFLARALVQEAPLLLLDEPTTALDIGHQQEVLELVDELRHDRKLTVLATMHDLSLAGGYADRLVLLAGGRVVADGTAADVLTERNLGEHYHARVRVVSGDDGPYVIPARSGRRWPAGGGGAGTSTPGG